VARSSSGESVLERVVRILEAFTPEERALTVGEVSRRAGLPAATGSRMVADLVEQGLLRRDGDRRVRVGTRLWELASRASPTLSLRELAMPVLEELLRAVGHHAQLGVLALAARVERLEPAGEPTRHLNNTMRAFASQPLRLHRAR
jgi:DNA-binding IclR family transcriptional regulator